MRFLSSSNSFDHPLPLPYYLAFIFRWYGTPFVGTKMTKITFKEPRFVFLASPPKLTRPASFTTDQPVFHLKSLLLLAPSVQVRREQSNRNQNQTNRLTLTSNKGNRWKNTKRKSGLSACLPVARYTGGARGSVPRPGQDTCNIFAKRSKLLAVNNHTCARGRRGHTPRQSQKAGTPSS